MTEVKHNLQIIIVVFQGIRNTLAAYFRDRHWSTCYLPLTCGFFKVLTLVEGTTQSKNHGILHEGASNLKDEDLRSIYLVQGSDSPDIH